MILRMTMVAGVLALAGPAAAQHSGTGNALPSAPERDLAPAVPAEDKAPPATHAGTGAAASDVDLFKTPQPPKPVSHGSAPPAVDLLRQPSSTPTAPGSQPTPEPPPAPAADAGAPAVVEPAPTKPAVTPPPAQVPAAATQPAPAEAAQSQTVPAPAEPPAPPAAEDRDMALYGPAAQGWQVWSRVRDGRAGCWAVRGGEGQDAPAPASGRLFDGPKPYVIVTMSATGAQPAWRIIHDGLPTEDDRIFVVGGTGWVESSSFASVLELDNQSIDVYGKGVTLQDGQRVPFETTGRIEMAGLGAAVGALTRCASGQPAPAPKAETAEDTGAEASDDAAAPAPAVGPEGN